jgi:ribosomal protein S18 acetylase RimI-like enzyme
MTAQLSITIATEEDAEAIAAVRNAAAHDLTRRFGPGHWSSETTAKSVRLGIVTSCVMVARDGEAAVGSLRLVKKKPWAIDPAHFTIVARPLYLVDMAVAPDVQRRGVGRRLLDEATAAAHAWPSEAIRLDAYDAAAGAAGFYARCGYREVGRATYRTVPLVYFELVL